MNALETTLNNFGKLGVQALKQDVQNVSTTGKTANSIRYEVTLKNEIYSLTFFARAFFSTLETGRGPRKSSAYGGFDNSLEEYLNAKGLESKTSKNGIKYFKLGNSWMSAKSLAYLINKEGDKTYKEGGRVIYSPTITKLVAEIKRAVTQDFIHSAITRIKNGFNPSTASGGNPG